MFAFRSELVPINCQLPQHWITCQFWRAGDVDGEESNSGATATVALVRRDKIVVANVGDSRAVVSRRRALAEGCRCWGRLHMQGST